MDQEHYDNIRLELIKLAKNKEIPYTQTKIKKMAYTDLDAVYSEYKTKELDDLNESFADILICKLDELMKSYEWIKQDSRLGKKLQDKKLFKSDVKNVVSYFTPFLPYVGLVEGGVTIVSEVLENKYDGSSTCEAPEGGEQSEITTEPDQHQIQ